MCWTSWVDEMTFSDSMLALVLTGSLLFAGLSACKELNQSRVGSYFDTVRELQPSSGDVRALTGVIDFEVPAPSQESLAQQSSPQTQPSAAEASLALNGFSDSTGVSSSGSGVTLRMQFSVVFDRPVADLDELGDLPHLARVGTLNTFNVVHVPGDARVDMETIGRPLYLVKTEGLESDTGSDCLLNCLRLVTGGGKLTDWSDIVILNLSKDELGGAWVLDWYNYFGAHVKDRPLPVQAVFVDKFDGAAQ